LAHRYNHHCLLRPSLRLHRHPNNQSLLLLHPLNISNSHKRPSSPTCLPHPPLLSIHSTVLVQDRCLFIMLLSYPHFLLCVSATVPIQVRQELRRIPLVVLGPEDNTVITFTCCHLHGVWPDLFFLYKPDLSPIFASPLLPACKFLGWTFFHLGAHPCYTMNLSPCPQTASTAMPPPPCNSISHTSPFFWYHRPVSCHSVLLSHYKSLLWHSAHCVPFPIFTYLQHCIPFSAMLQFFSFLSHCHCHANYCVSHSIFLTFSTTFLPPPPPYNTQPWDTDLDPVSPSLPQFPFSLFQNQSN
jgi:hypothetical protein